MYTFGQNIIQLALLISYLRWTVLIAFDSILLGTLHTPIGLTPGFLFRAISRHASNGDRAEG